MTPFLLGLLTGGTLSVCSLYALLRSAKRTSAICRALQALHGVAVSEVLQVPSTPAQAVTPPPNAYEECVSALVGLGAKKQQAQVLANDAVRSLSACNMPITAEGLIREAMQAKGRIQ